MSNSAQCVAKYDKKALQKEIDESEDGFKKTMLKRIINAKSCADANRDAVVLGLYELAKEINWDWGKHE